MSSTTSLDNPQRLPDLQRLVEISGGYDKITPSAWAQFDADMAAYYARMITPPASTGERSRLVSIRLYPSFEECPCCYARGVFGYRAETLAHMGQPAPAALIDEPSELLWFCDQHKPSKYFADARRDT
jgi:hypothetical protein